MRTIPEKLRIELGRNPWYSRCCLTGWTRGMAKIEWHHNFEYAGRQVNEEWCILPLRKDIHDEEKRPDIQERLQWIMLSRAPDMAIRQYGLEEARRKAIKKFGKYDLYGRYWHGF